MRTLTLLSKLDGDDVGVDCSWIFVQIIASMRGELFFWKLFTLN